MYTISYPSGTLRKDGAVFEQRADSQEYQEYLAWLKLDNGPTVLADAADPPPVIQVNAWQIRLALNALGLRDAVETAVVESGNKDLQDGWNHSPTFSSNFPLTINMGAALGMSEAQMYDLFVFASGL